MKTNDTLINRRNFLGIVAGSTAAAAVPRLAFSTNIIRPDDKPNLMFILTDDQSYHDLGCYGNTAIRTPNMDELATEGMKFDNAFTVTAMCVPSRSSLYSGLYPHRNGAHPNHSAVRSGVKTVPHYMKELG